MRRTALGALALLLSSTALAGDGLRVVTWNITNYAGGRDAAFQTSIYGVFEGRSLDPDVIAVQEILSQGAVDAFVSILNTAPGSPGDWAAAPFVDGRDTDNAMFYRQSRVAFLGMTIVALGAPPPAQPRDTNRYDFLPYGYASDDATIAYYSSHMKAGSSSDDKARRLLEAQAIRGDAESLPDGWSFILGGDFNIQSSGQAAYQELVGAQANNDGRFFDPIATPGSWQNNSSYRFVHSQDPNGGGGMDDRYDQLLLSASLIDNESTHYIGDAGTPYSTVTWDDPNHSHRCWGNDGSSYNLGLTVNGNTMVGPAIALALIQTTGGQSGHLPVYVDLAVPAKVSAPAVLDLGAVPSGAPASAALTIANAADIARWGAGGIDELDYQLLASPGIDAPGANFELAAGDSAEHTITVTPASPGFFEGLVLVSSDDPDTPTLEIVVTALFTDGCSAADLAEPFGELDFSDILAFLSAFAGMQGAADLAEPLGVYDFSDVIEFLSVFAAGCP